MKYFRLKNQVSTGIEIPEWRNVRILEIRCWQTTAHWVRSGPTTVFVNKLLLEHNCCHSVWSHVLLCGSMDCSKPDAPVLHYLLGSLLNTSRHITVEHHFRFGPATSFFLELLVIALCSSPVANWTPSDLGGLSSSVISFCLFILLMGFSRQKYWGDLPFPPPVDHVLSELSTMTHPSWVALHSMTHSFIELRKPLPQDKAVIHEGVEHTIYLHIIYASVFRYTHHFIYLDIFIRTG